MGCFASQDGVRYPRGARVICRTQRGLEHGQVLASQVSGSTQVDGELLRAVTVQDELLLERIERRPRCRLRGLR